MEESARKEIQHEVDASIKNGSMRTNTSRGIEIQNEEAYSEANASIENGHEYKELVNDITLC